MTYIILQILRHKEECLRNPHFLYVALLPPVLSTILERVLRVPVAIVDVRTRTTGSLD